MPVALTDRALTAAPTLPPALAALLMGGAAFVMFSVRFMSRTDAEAARERDAGE